MERQHSGTDRPATIRELASVFDSQDFPIWDRESLNDLPSNEQWAELANPHLFTLRLATVILTKQKSELLEMVGNLETRTHEGTPLIEDLVPQFHHTEGFLQAMLKTIEGAESRLLGAACKRAVMAGMGGLDEV